jgi:hypothetical protein
MWYRLFRFEFKLVAVSRIWVWFEQCWGRCCRQTSPPSRPRCFLSSLFLLNYPHSPLFASGCHSLAVDTQKKPIVRLAILVAISVLTFCSATAC